MCIHCCNYQKIVFAEVFVVYFQLWMITTYLERS